MNSRTTNSNRETSRSKNSRSANAKASSRGSDQKTKSGRRSSKSTQQRDWTDGVQSGARSFEKSVSQAVTEKPFLALAIAAGAGLLTYFVMKKIADSSDEESIFDSSIDNAPTQLAEKLSDTLARFQSEFDSLSHASFVDVKDNVIQLMIDEVSENPFGALATAASIGFGLGSLQLEDLKQGAIRLAKVAAVQSLDGITGATGGSTARLSDAH